MHLPSAALALLPLLLLLLSPLLRPAAGLLPLTITRVSGCMDMGVSTDNCTAGQRLTLQGSNFLAAHDYVLGDYGVEVSVSPNWGIQLTQQWSFVAYTNTSIVAVLPSVYPSMTGVWQNVSLTTGRQPNGVVDDSSAEFGPAFRYAMQQPPYVQYGQCQQPDWQEAYPAYCSSHSNLRLYGYYMGDATAVWVWLTLPDGRLAFNTSCADIAIATERYKADQPEYFNLTCRLPSLDFSGSVAHNYPALVVQVTSPRGSGLISQWPMTLNATHSPNSGMAVLAPPARLAVGTLATLLLMAVCAEWL